MLRKGDAHRGMSVLGLYYPLTRSAMHEARVRIGAVQPSLF